MQADCLSESTLTALGSATALLTLSALQQMQKAEKRKGVGGTAPTPTTSTTAVQRVSLQNHLIFLQTLSFFKKKKNGGHDNSEHKNQE